jgi:hypothetical protein
LPFTRIPDQGRIGAKGLANMRPVQSVAWNGVDCPAWKPVDIGWETTADNAAGELYLFFIGDTDGRKNGRIFLDGRNAPAQWNPLGNGWCVARVPLSPGLPVSGVRVVAATNLVLVQVSMLSAAGYQQIPFPKAPPLISHSNEVPVESRWLRPKAALDLPDGGTNGIRLLVLSRAGRDHEEPVGVKVVRSGDRAEAAFTALPQWSWSVLAFPARGNPSCQDRFLFSTATAWDPKTVGFPNALGFRLSRVTVIPALP